MSNTIKLDMKFIVSILSLVFIISSCSKYEEGPAFSLLTKKARITGNWKPEKKVTSEGDEEFYMPDLVLKIHDNNVFELLESNNITLKGTWEFFDDKTSLRFIYDAENEVDNVVVENIVEFEIIRLKKNELWLEDTYGEIIKYVPA